MKIYFFPKKYSVLIFLPSMLCVASGGQNNDKFGTGHSNSSPLSIFLSPTKKNAANPTKPPMAKKLSNPKKEAAILETLTDFTSKENWDKFFTLRGGGDSFEWYADWPSLRDPIVSQLSRCGADADTFRILVPGCGSSRLSEYVYDLGFRNITNIDFSKVAVSDMLKRYVRSRPKMKWRVMDMTQMQVTMMLEG